MEFVFKDDVKIEKNKNNEFKIFVCVPRDIGDSDEVRIVYAKDRDDVKEQIIRQESQDPTFREHVDDFSLDCGLSSTFYCDEQGWLFSNNPDLYFRPDLYIQFDTDRERSRYVEAWYLNNAMKFFYKRLDLYLEFVCGREEDGENGFSDVFYYYCAKNIDNWNSWKITEVYYG
jgi:hypothetical protein